MGQKKCSVQAEWEVSREDESIQHLMSNISCLFLALTSASQKCQVAECRTIFVASVRG